MGSAVVSGISLASLDAQLRSVEELKTNVSDLGMAPRSSSTHSSTRSLLGFIGPSLVDLPQDLVLKVTANVFMDGGRP